MTNQKQFSLWGVLFLIGAELVGMFFVGLGYRTTIGIFRSLEWLAGIATFLVGLAVFINTQASWQLRLRGSLLIWAGSGLILGLLIARFPFLWVAGLLLSAAFIADIFLIGLLLVFAPKDLRLAALSIIGPMIILLFWGPGLQPVNVYLGLAIAVILNSYWVGRWYRLYREPCPAEAVMHMAVNLTAVWLYHLWQIRWSLG